MKSTNVFLCLAMLSVIGASCKKHDDAASTSYNIRMTDAPAPYSAVYIDLQSIELTGTNGLTVLNVNKGIYNLLDFSNGMDTLIASGTMDVTTVQQVRLILGPNNSVVADGVSHPLSVPSAEQSGLKLQVHNVLQSGVQYSVLLDFDANQSIILEGNGNYKLKPVIRTIETAVSGAISGKISAVGTLASVTATSDVSYSTSVMANGDFLLRGVPAGTYTLTLTPALPFGVVTKTNITVTTGITTNVGTIVL
jgi:hypothetical protein